MTIQPTLSFSFSPTCQSFSCCCFGGHDSESSLYPNKDGRFKSMNRMTDKEVEIANERFRLIIIRKIDTLPLDNDEFLDRLENEEGISLEVTRECPLTKERLNKTIEAINRIIKHWHID